MKTILAVVLALAMNTSAADLLTRKGKRYQDYKITGVEKEVGAAWDGLDVPGKKAIIDGGGEAIKLSAAEDTKFRKIGAGVENAKLVPEFVNFSLNWRSRSQQEVSGSWADAHHEFEEVIILVFLRPHAATTPGLVRFIQDHGAIPALQQVFPLLRIMEDEAG